MKPPGRRRLGVEGPWVSSLGLGCMGMSASYGRRDEDEAKRTIGAALDLGIDHFDTATLYGWGRNEELVGRALAGRRDEAFIATKFGIVRDEEGRRFPRGDHDFVIASCDESLRRLGCDHIDLLYQHRVDPDVPIEETVGAMAELVEAGKVRHLGLSEAGPESIRRAAAVHRIAAVQSEWSLWSRDIESRVLPAARERGIAVVAYSPLGRGFLTGAPAQPEALDPGDFRRTLPRFAEANFATNKEILGRLTSIADELGWTVAQLAIGWVLARGEDTIPIPGASSRGHLEQNLAAARMDLDSDVLERIERAVPPEAWSGARYPDMSEVEGDTAAKEGP